MLNCSCNKLSYIRATHKFYFVLVTSIDSIGAKIGHYYYYFIVRETFTQNKNKKKNVKAYFDFNNLFQKVPA